MGCVSPPRPNRVSEAKEKCILNKGGGVYPLERHSEICLLNFFSVVHNIIEEVPRKIT